MDVNSRNIFSFDHIRRVCTGKELAAGPVVRLYDKMVLLHVHIQAVVEPNVGPAQLDNSNESSRAAVARSISDYLGRQFTADSRCCVICRRP